MTLSTGVTVKAVLLHPCAAIVLPVSATAGLTVIVKLTAGPIQPFAVGVTEIVPVLAIDVSLRAVNARFPEPLAPRPIAVLVFVQLKVDPAVPVKLTVTGAPLHTIWLPGLFTVAVGLTVMVKVMADPEHPFTAGVTVMVAVWGVAPELAAVKEEIFPDPAAARPIEVFELVQL